MTATDVLVFGRDGQVGRELMRAPIEDLRVVGLSRQEADITDSGTIAVALDRARPAVVINAAAYTAVDKAETEIEAAFAVNRDGAADLADACARRGLPLIHLSTDYVFDGEKSGPYVEDDPVAPLNVYGRSKEAGEKAIRARLPHHVILRTEWVYSPFGQNFVKTMLRLGVTRPELSVVDDQRGTPTSARAIASAILTIARRLIAMPDHGYGTFHFTAAGETTWYGFAAEIFRLAAARGWAVPRLAPIPSAAYPTPARRPRNSLMDCRRIGLAHGIIPTPWQDELDLCLSELATAADLPR